MERIADFADVWGCPPQHGIARMIWRDALARISADSGQHRELVDDGRDVPAYVSCNRWVADCLHCGDGAAFMVARWMPEGCCLACGRVFRVVFPPDVDAAVEILEQRPDPRTRNWNAHTGEAIAGLARENELFGGIGVVQEPWVDPDTYQQFVVATDDVGVDDDPDARYQDHPAEELLAKLETGYTVRHEGDGLAVVEIINQPTKAVASIKKAMGGASIEELIALDPEKGDA